MKLNAFTLHNLGGDPFLVSPEDVAVVHSKFAGYDHAGAVIHLQNGSLLATLETYEQLSKMLALALKASDA